MAICTVCLKTIFHVRGKNVNVDDIHVKDCIETDVHMNTMGIPFVSPASVMYLNLSLSGPYPYTCMYTRTR